jgi:protein-L-isoaspartate(D-aspartate) O-methyltransferase
VSGEDIADVRFVPFDRGAGWAIAKEGEVRAPARRVLRPVSQEILVRNLADAAESFPSIEGLISIS